MELNINDGLKIRVLKQLSDRKVYSFYLLSKAVGANNTTVKKNCNFCFIRFFSVCLVYDNSPSICMGDFYN